MSALTIDQEDRLREELAETAVSAWGEPLTAFRTTQGKQTRYTFTAPLAYLVDTVKRPDPREPFPGNRKVELTRARSFRDYLRDNATGNHGWTFPPIQLRTTQERIRETVVVSEIGLVKIRVPRGSHWDIQDGQHRVLGVYLFAEETEKKIAELRNHLSRNEADTKVRQEFREIEQVRHIILNESQVEVVLVVADDRTHGLMFADIARYAKGINPDFATKLNTRDPVDRIAQDIIETFAPLAGLVSSGQAGRVGITSKDILGAKAVADICRSVIVGPGRIGKKIRGDIEENEALWRERIKEFLAVLFETFPDLEHLRAGEIDAPTLRGQSLIASSTMWRALAIAWHLILYKGDRLAVPDVRRFFANLEPHLRCFTDVQVVDPKTGKLVTRHGVPKDHPLWESTGKVRVGNRTLEGRNSDVNDLGRIFESWARQGLPLKRVTYPNSLRQQA